MLTFAPVVPRPGRQFGRAWRVNGLSQMMITKRQLQNIWAFVGVLFLATAATAQDQAKAEVAPANIHIKNFGQMDDRFYRGAQPGKNDYRDLAALGIKTVIDLREDSEPYEQPLV